MTKVRIPLHILGLALSITASLLGQAETTLREAFEGKEVFVRVDMPATKYGIDVHPEASRSVDFSLVGRRIRQYGVALHRGDSAILTRVKVHHKSIEFQLGGSGDGTFGDALQTRLRNPVPSTYVPKSRRQKRLELEYKASGDSTVKNRLDDAKDRRRREPSRLRVEAATARVMQQQQIRDQAASSGSRFDLKFHGPVPRELLTPAGLRGMLHEHVDFPGAEGPVQRSDTADFSA